MVANLGLCYDTMHNLLKNLIQHDSDCLPIDMHHYDRNYSRSMYYSPHLHGIEYSLMKSLHELLLRDNNYYD